MRRMIVPMVLLLCPVLLAHADVPYWYAPTKEVHSHFTGTSGTISRFGDSITVSMAYFNPLRYAYSNTTPDSQAALTWLWGYANSSIWSWQDSAHGAEGGTDSYWPLSRSGFSGQGASESNLAYWLRTMNPEMVVIMWGTNDVQHGVSQSAYINNMRQVVQACKANGSIPILTAIPPRHGYATLTSNFAQAMRDLALEQKVPLIDYGAEVLTRHPHNPPVDTWDGADAMWSAYTGYEVPTSISRDGVHPSNWTPGKSNFSEYGLNTNGFNLRNYLTLMKMHESYKVMTARQGDTDFDGDVDFRDYQTVELHFGMTTGATWLDGDTDFDGDVDFFDYQRMEVNFGRAVPEPGAVLLLTAGALALLRRRWRQ